MSLTIMMLSSFYSCINADICYGGMVLKLLSMYWLICWLINYIISNCIYILESRVCDLCRLPNASNNFQSIFLLRLLMLSPIPMIVLLLMSNSGQLSSELFYDQLLMILMRSINNYYTLLGLHSRDM